MKQPCGYGDTAEDEIIESEEFSTAAFPTLTGLCCSTREAECIYEIQAAEEIVFCQEVGLSITNVDVYTCFVLYRI